MMRIRKRNGMGKGASGANEGDPAVADGLVGSSKEQMPIVGANVKIEGERLADFGVLGDIDESTVFDCNLSGRKRFAHLLAFDFGHSIISKKELA